MKDGVRNMKNVRKLRKVECFRILRMLSFFVLFRPHFVIRTQLKSLPE